MSAQEINDEIGQEIEAKCYTAYTRQGGNVYPESETEQALRAEIASLKANAPRWTLQEALKRMPKSKTERLNPEDILAFEESAHVRVSFGPDRHAGTMMHCLIAHIRYLEKCLEMSTPTICGENPILPSERVGCEMEIRAEHECYRCYDCGTPFHRDCLKAHCGIGCKHTELVAPPSEPEKP